MTDTARTLSQLQTTFADNVLGDISAQDLRDFLVSMKQPFGNYYRNSASATTISVAGTYYKAAGTSTAGRLYLFTHTDNRLTYTGALDTEVIIHGHLSMTTAGTADILGIKLAKNGTVIDNTVVRRKVGTGTDIGAAGITGITTLSTGDYIEIWVTNEDATASVTLDEYNLTVQGDFT